MTNRFTQALEAFTASIEKPNSEKSFNLIGMTLDCSWPIVKEALTLAASLENNPYGQAPNEPFHTGEK